MSNETLITSRRKALTLALAGTAALAVPTQALADDKPHRTMSLSATGAIAAEPDMAVITIGVQSEARTAAEALTDNNTSMHAVMDLLRAEGLEDRDIQTAQFSVSPRYRYDEDTRTSVLIGYTVTNQVVATIRDLAQIGKILDAAVRSGSNTIGDIRFDVSDSSPLEEEARKRAVAELLERANLYADAADFELGDIQSLSESGGYQPEVRSYALAEAADASVPIAGGEVTVQVTVTITWEIH